MRRICGNGGSAAVRDTPPPGCVHGRPEPGCWACPAWNRRPDTEVMARRRSNGGLMRLMGRDNAVRVKVM
ncbi:MAG: hypothetical protein LBQ88_20220 [Treponema sp.]|nr:hypothetical protein [Treponema sp.]